MEISEIYIGEIKTIRLENKTIRMDVAPSVGGKITSIYSKPLTKEFLWTNKSLKLQQYPVGTSYDPCFFGGIDELLPSDIPELVQGVAYPDHGELWTMNPDYVLNENGMTIFGKLPLSELYYEKVITLDQLQPLVHIDYTITNQSVLVKHFLWKLHAALQISEGDRMECSATKGQVVDPEYSRFKSTTPFDWPVIEGTDASKVPAENGTVDFYYLFASGKGEMSMISPQNNSRFTYIFDPKVFPYLWYFASYGGFLGHYTAILEPCTTMPISVNDAIALNQCSFLEPGKSIRTRVSIYAGIH
jgi:hypothetical protein